jgi:putative phage-type endonuclease
LEATLLSPQQHKQREGKLTSSRVACLMSGDAEAIMRLYREMIGEAEPEDLSHVWPVRLGEATEPLHLDWLEMTGFTIKRRGDVVVHPRHPWAAATLDGWVIDLNCPVEVKHAGGREPFEVLIDRYQPQVQWQMEVTGATQCLFSAILGANPPIPETIERDPDYAAEMIKRGQQFMAAVADRRPPVALPAAPVPAIAHKVYEMSSNPSWTTHAQRWLQTHGAAETARECEKVLKSLVPEDARKCHGNGAQITRNRAGHLSLREAVQ